MACEKLMEITPTIEGEIDFQAALKAAKLGSEAWTPIAMALGDAEVQDTVMLAHLTKEMWGEAMTEAGTKPLAKLKVNILANLLSQKTQLPMSDLFGKPTVAPIVIDIGHGGGSSR